MFVIAQETQGHYFYQAGSFTDNHLLQVQPGEVELLSVPFLLSVAVRR